MAENKRDFAEDQRICDAATAGPWLECALTRGYVIAGDRSEFDVVAAVIEYNDNGTEHLHLGGPACASNRRFIAEARTGWPAALAEIERLQAENERMRTVLDTLEAQAWNDVRMRTGGVSVGLPVFTSLHLARGIIRDIDWARGIPESNSMVTEVTAYGDPEGAD